MSGGCPFTTTDCHSPSAYFNLIQVNITKSSLVFLLIDITLVLAFLGKSTKFGAKRPLALSLGFPRLLEVAAATAEPADPRSGAGPGRADSLHRSDLAQPAGQDWRLSQPPPGHGHCLHTGIVTHWTDEHVYLAPVSFQ